MKTALVILAAGIGSRYGGGIKQLEPVGPTGEIIMDYSIHDAIEAGFNKIVFIIRKDIEADFREVIGNRVEALGAGLGVEVTYAFQEKEDLPSGCSFSGVRQKPWGTGQALWACRDVLHEPFVVINADDYYGKEAFRLLYSFLQNYSLGRANCFALAGFVLANTLSENGGVTRGICRVKDGMLEGITETKNIITYEGGAAVDHKDGTVTVLDPASHVSMNMWALTPEFISALEKGFRNFLQTEPETLAGREFLLPTFVDSLLQQGKITVEVLPSADSWFGVTYREDKPYVVASFRKLIEQGIYRADLFSDMMEPVG